MCGNKRHVWNRQWARKPFCCTVRDDETWRAHVECRWWPLQQWEGQICAEEVSASKLSWVLDLQEESGVLTHVGFFFSWQGFQQKTIFSKKIRFSWQTMMWHVYSHISWFRLLFLFTSANAPLLMLWGLCKVAELSEVPAELFCCRRVCLFSEYISPGFSSLQLGVFGLSTTGEHRQGQHEMLCPATLFSSGHLWQHGNHSRPRSFLCRGKIVHKEGSVLCPPRTRLGVSSSFQIILWRALSGNVSVFSVQPTSAFSLGAAMLQVGYRLSPPLCWGLLSCRCTRSVRCRRTASLVMVKKSNSSS